MAHGFVPSQNGNDIEVEGREIFTELIRRSLFQYHHSSPVSTIGRVCKMHDLIHDLAHFVMKNECFTTLKSSAATEILIRPRHLYLDANENFKQGDCSIIRTVLYCRRDLSVLSKLKLVRVLDLNRAYLDELPASIEHLHHLRYFYISNARIRKLPESICMLVNLQTLILYNCPILSELPKSITYMNSLRHLRFDYCPHIKVLPAGLSRLQNLKTLTRYTVEDDAESNIRQLKLLNLGGKVMLYNLQKVKSADDAREANLGYKQNIDKLILNWKARDFLGDNESCSMENAEDVFEGLKPHNKVKELRVSYYPGKQFPIWMRERQQFQYLHQIELLGCRECEQLPPLETLPCLEYLRISQMDGIKHIVNNRRGNALQTFPSLKNLMLSRMRSLEGWCVEEGREANLPLFPCLVWMDITECPKLTTMPLEILPCLEDLSISDMDGIKHIVNDRRGNSVQLFPVLKKLILSEMRNLERWCVEEGREENVSLFPCLIWMDIRGCPKLTSMPFGILPCLKDLSISQMDGIKHIVNNSRGNVPPSFPALKKLTLSEMRNLKGWCLEEGREANMSLFPCLIRMDIRKCPKFTTMPPIPTLQELYLVLSFCETQISLMSTKRCFFKHLGSLRSLNINSCTEELLLLLEDKEETRSMKSSLENLCIGNCNQLSLTLVLQNLTSLRDLWVDSLEKLVSWPDEMRGLESLNKLTISSCKNFTGASSQGDCSPPFLKSLQVSDCDALRELPMCPKSLQSLIILNCPGIDSLWPDMGHLTALSSLKVSNCPTLMSLSDGKQGLTSLESLCIIDCPGLKSFPKGLQQLLSTLKSLTVQGCPELERLCKPGGDYYSLFSDVSYKRIGVQPEETIQVPHEISTGAKQALKCITTNPFLLSAISICAVACSINFLVNKLDSKKEQEVWYIPPT
ncbi:putative leucine-rich repeat domain superfamily [Dioscorea sansibarensis]